MLDIGEIEVRPVSAPEERLFQDLMLRHHYLGALPKIGETIWYVAAWREQWVALSSFFAAALKCAARDSWVGWDFRLKYQRLKLVTNNSRFFILPQWHRNLSMKMRHLFFVISVVFPPSQDDLSRPPLAHEEEEVSFL